MGKTWRGNGVRIMLNSDAVKILQDELICLKRGCKKGVRNCSRCTHKRTEVEIFEAKSMAIEALRKQKRLKMEFFKSGIEYAKSEFVRLLEEEKNNVGQLHKEKLLDDFTYTQVLGLQKAEEITDNINYKVVEDIGKEDI